VPAPATYPGWDQFYDQLRRLIDGVNGDDIPLDNNALPRPPKVTKDRLVDALRKAANQVPADHRCPCDVPTKQVLLDAIARPRGQNYDWTPWSARWKGTWWRPGGDPLPLCADWLRPERRATTGPGARAQDAEGMQGVPPGRTRSHKQDVVFRNPETNEVERRGWNVSDDERGFVWGWDPKDYGAQWRKAVHIGYPFDNGACRCIIWLTSANAYLECVSADNSCYSIAALDGHGKLTRDGDAKPAK
jgi:hypothetical protein